MKHLSKLLMVLLAGLVAFSSCKETPDTNIDTTECSLTLETQSVEIDGNGGTYSIGYVLKNGINGIDIAAEVDATWIDNLRTSESRLYFDYKKNFTNKEREAKIAVRYPNLSMQIIKIKQTASDALTFEMEICDIKTTSCTSKLYPSDKETPYIVYMAEKDYILGSQISTEEELFLDDYHTFTDWAKEYGAANLKKFMEQYEISFTGDSYIGWTGMVPDKEYIIYAYAIEFNEEGTDYTLASAVTHEIVILPTHLFSDIEFEVEISVDGPKATYEFAPVNWDGKYYIDIYAEGDYMYVAEGETPNEAYCKQVANNWIGMINIYMQSGYSAEQLLELMCLQGPDSYSEERLSDTKYCMVFYGIEMVDGLPQVTTRPYIAHFQTEKVEASDMTIDFKVENCYVRVADIEITPSKDEPYVATFLRKSDIPYSENDKIIKWLLGYDLSSNTYHGTIQSNIVGLEPDTEYVAIAFGYYGGVVTTDLFRYDFKTEPEGECENSVLGVTVTAPYSLVELEAAMPDAFYNYGMFEMMGWYAMCAEIETEKPEGNVFMNIYSASELVTSDMEYIKADVCSYVSDRSCLFVGENDELYIMCAVTMDYRGNYSEMWISDPFSFSLNNGVRDINEFLDKLGLQAEVQSAKPSSIDLRLNK
ncbi:MAG: BACON domain-containing protein [Alistipes sp.]|nr:BACON domain-containing protein [Alistipes sp.]